MAWDHLNIIHCLPCFLSTGLLLLPPRTTFNVRWMEPQNSTLDFSILSYFTGINQGFKCIHNPFINSASLEESLSIVGVNSRQSLIKYFSLSRTLMNSKNQKSCWFIETQQTKIYKQSKSKQVKWKQLKLILK